MLVRIDRGAWAQRLDHPVRPEQRSFGLRVVAHREQGDVGLGTRRGRRRFGGDASLFGLPAARLVGFEAGNRERRGEVTGHG